MRTIFIIIIAVASFFLMGLSNCQKEDTQDAAVIMWQSLQEDGVEQLQDSIHNEEYPNMPYVPWLVLYQVTIRDTLDYMPSQPQRKYKDRLTFARVIFKQGKRSITHEEFKKVIPNADLMIYAERKDAKFVFSYK